MRGGLSRSLRQLIPEGLLRFSAPPQPELAALANKAMHSWTGSLALCGFRVCCGLLVLYQTVKYVWAVIRSESTN